ncbi:MAG TPA: metallophosphoesterase [Thermoanaerobacterales bacterium]|nr:metallophosphoesterase [Thermoanaerobacterales bacterium]
MFFYFQTKYLQITEYNVSSAKIPEELSGFKILQLSDLHSKQFGENNEFLIKGIEELNPDIIVATGDMLNSTNDDGKVFYDLAKYLVKHFKIYYIKGNHEQIAEFKAREVDSHWFDAYMGELEDLGVVVLNNDKAEITHKNATINLYGLDISLRLYRGEYTATYDGEKSIEVSNIEKALGACEDGKYNILLTHNPAYFSVYSAWGADLILAGHVHGGAVRIPFIGGLLSPERSFFPKYDAGKYELNKSKMIVSRGLGESTIKLRVFNPPEIIMITLVSETE